MVVNKKMAKCFLSSFSILLIAIIVLQSAHAYVLQGGRLNKGVINQTYYIGITNQTLSQQCEKAMNDWNYAVKNTAESSNMGFSFTRSNNITGTTIRFWGENLPSQSWHGLTRYYTLDNKLNATQVTNAQNRDYASCILNTSKDATATQWKVIAAHEAGHGMGLKHTNDTGTIMYPYFDICTATSPTHDDVMGIYNKYR